MTLRTSVFVSAGVILAGVLGITGVEAQRGLTPAQQQAQAERQALTRADHQDMLDQLGITELRPGPSGNMSDPNAANTDEALANPYPELPDPLTFDDGRRVTTADQWPARRAEIAEHFEREVYGRIPEGVPGVTWSVAEQLNGTVGGRPVVGRQLVGHVDNSAAPEIEVDIQFTLVTPADAGGPVPVMIMFRGGTLQQALGLAPQGRGRVGGPAAAQGPVDPPATDQLIAAGWGFAFLNPASVQADNGAGLTQGIIGLTNKGARRTPEQWGSLRAWAWGAARALDYLETDESVDATRVGIEGVSRYGKAALVTMAFEPRFAVVLVGSAGEGGVSLMRRNFGEMVENLTGSGEYHWMAGNFLKYGASAGRSGDMNASHLPVDAHSLLALAAPRPVFISYGVPERGDALWLDQQGSFMAAVAAGPVFRLLGARDLGTSDDYMAEKMPPVLTGLLDGQLAWRQHDGGHTDGPNWRYFIPWADRMLGRQASGARTSPAASGPIDWRTIPGDRPVERRDENSRIAHEQLLAKTKQGQIDVYFIGDSITRRWGATDYPDFLSEWRDRFSGWNAANFAWGGDRTQHMLWRLRNGELDGVQPKVFVLQAGANNIDRAPFDAERAADLTRGIEAIIDTVRSHSPNAVIVITGVFPRDDNPGALEGVKQVNANLARKADGRMVRFIDLTDELIGADGRFKPGMSPDGLHLSLPGYEVWADALTPIFEEVLGPRADVDNAPPPTGDPSAR